MQITDFRAWHNEAWLWRIFLQHTRRCYNRDAGKYVRTKKCDADTFMGNDRNGIKISCTGIWQSMTVLFILSVHMRVNSVSPLRKKVSKVSQTRYLQFNSWYKRLKSTTPTQSIGVCCSHKVVAVGFNTLCYDARSVGVLKPPHE